MTDHSNMIQNCSGISAIPLFNEYTEGFFGYGSWANSIWLVGSEEKGCGKDPNEFHKRFRVWCTFEKKDLVDLIDFHRKPNYETGVEIRWENATWMWLFCLCRLSGFEIECLREGNRRWGGEPRQAEKAELYVSLMEASPFPAPSTREWPYKGDDLPFSRGKSLTILIKRRLESLAEKIGQYRPTVVIGYGAAVRGMIAILQGRGWESGHPIDGATILRCPKNKSLFCHINHPARGRFNPGRIGDAIKNLRHELH